MDDAARERGTSPANWIRSLALVHLAEKPQWTPAEIEALRELAREVRAIGNNVNQIARALNVAVQTGEYPPHQGIAAREAVELVRVEVRRRIVAAMTGNFDYWGLPDAERPTAARGRLRVPTPRRAQAAAEATACLVCGWRSMKRRAIMAPLVVVLALDRAAAVQPVALTGGWRSCWVSE